MNEELSGQSEKDRILFVDDEALILFALRRFFKMNNIEVDVETDCIKAVDLIREKKYKVIISDFKMPSMNGADFLEIVKEVSPESVRLVLSAHITQESLAEIVNKSEVYRFLSKPWKDKELLGVIKDSIDKYDKQQALAIDVVISPVDTKKNFGLPKPDTTQNATQSELGHIEQDAYFQNILPSQDFSTVDTKKLCDVLRNEEHSHLSYVINLVSNKIGLHCKRVAQLSAYIAKANNLTTEQQKNVYYAGLYHDIGKIYELAAQVEHCELGFNILSQFHELKDAALIVKDHHKRFDDQNAGQILKEAKILAVVDYFDKVVNKEKKDDEVQRTLADIIGEMMAEKGKKFDPEIMDNFKEIIERDFKLEMFFKETKVHFIDIEEGMILSRPLFNIEGKMLLNCDYKITKDIIVRLFKHHKVIPIKSPFYVYTKAPEKTFNFEEFLAKKINKAVA